MMMVMMMMMTMMMMMIVPTSFGLLKGPQKFQIQFLEFTC